MVNSMHLFAEVDLAREFHPYCRQYPRWQGNVGRTVSNDRSILAQLTSLFLSLNEVHLSLGPEILTPSTAIPRKILQLDLWMENMVEGTGL